MTTQFEYFDSQSKNIKIIKSAVKEQGVDVCHGAIDTIYIRHSIQDFLFGFINIGKKANIGQKQTSPAKNSFVKSFILCEKVKISNTFLNITLVCSRLNVKNGRELMGLVEQNAKELGYDTLTLHAVGAPSIVKWYEKQGFVVDNVIYNNHSDDVKAYYMFKKI